MWQAIQSVEWSLLPVHSMPTHYLNSSRRQSSHLPSCRPRAGHGAGNTTEPNEASDSAVADTRAVRIGALPVEAEATTDPEAGGAALRATELSEDFTEAALRVLADLGIVEQRDWKSSLARLS